MPCNVWAKQKKSLRWSFGWHLTRAHSLRVPIILLTVAISQCNSKKTKAPGGSIPAATHEKQPAWLEVKLFAQATAALYRHAGPLLLPCSQHPPHVKGIG